MPAVRSAGARPGERVVLVSELEEWAQLPFAGYKCAHACMTAQPMVLASAYEAAMRLHEAGTHVCCPYAVSLPLGAPAW